MAWTIPSLDHPSSKVLAIMIRCAALSALLLVAPALACAGQAPKHPILDLARTWSGDNSAFKCEPATSGNSDIADQRNPHHCVWQRATPGTPVETIKAGVDLGGGPSLVMWDRFARDDADAARVIDSLDVALRRQELRRHECGVSAVSRGGQVREILWVGSELLLFLMHLERPDSLPRLMIVASDDAATMPRPTLCHLKAAPDAMWPAERGSAPSALRWDMVLGVVDFQLDRRSVLAVIQYRTNAPAKDSAAVRTTLTERLARPKSMFMAQGTGVVPSRTTRLIIRPCYTDLCPALGTGLPLIPGDLEFGVRPDSSWAPSERTRAPLM